MEYKTINGTINYDTTIGSKVYSVKICGQSLHDYQIVAAYIQEPKLIWNETSGIYVHDTNLEPFWRLVTPDIIYAPNNEIGTNGSPYCVISIIGDSAATSQTNIPYLR